VPPGLSAIPEFEHKLLPTPVGPFEMIVVVVVVDGGNGVVVSIIVQCCCPCSSGRNNQCSTRVGVVAGGVGSGCGIGGSSGSK